MTDHIKTLLIALVEIAILLTAGIYLPSLIYVYNGIYTIGLLLIISLITLFILNKISNDQLAEFHLKLQKYLNPSYQMIVFFVTVNISLVHIYINNYYGLTVYLLSILSSIFTVYLVYKEKT